MKTNEAPEKIYVHEASAPELAEKLPYHIEYIRKDAFIEKACDWLESVNLDFYQIREGVFSRQLVEDFRKAMKGE